MTERKDTPAFISCIKVKGIHLLPPVISQKRRAELQGYKQQAMKLEKRLKNCKDLKQNLDDLLSIQPLTDRPYSEVSFRSDSHIDALGILEKTNSNNNVSSKTRKIRLSKDIIDVTQYNSDGIRVIYNDGNNIPYEGHDLSLAKDKLSQSKLSYQPTSDQSDKSSNLNKSVSLELTISDNKTSLNNSVENVLRSVSPSVSPSLKKSPKSRLIRSNSYTLETPSPILLAHLEKNCQNNVHDTENSEPEKQLPITRNWSSLENNYIPFENSEFSSINTVYNTNLDKPDDKNMQCSTPVDKIEEPNVEKNTSPAIKVIQTDVSVQKITVNTDNESLHNMFEDKCEASDSQLMQVLRSLPDIYAKQIIDLIESQRIRSATTNSNKSSHQTNNRDRSNEINDLNEPLLSMNVGNEYKNDSQNIQFSQVEKGQGSNTSISPSHSVYYSVTSSDTIRPLSNSSLRLIDFDCDDAVVFDERPESPRKTDIIEFYVHEEVGRNLNASRELFPQHDRNSTTEQEWAASVIGAHVKGYLTRRLLKTERVQSLIETIKDALMCALQLHNSENIDESDVELHRRLINQVSAACYTFHDIFFALTVQEQMLIIATDRQRKLEKAKRPASASSIRRSKSSSIQSTPRQRLPSHSQSLTKV